MVYNKKKSEKTVGIPAVFFCGAGFCYNFDFPWNILDTKRKFFYAGTKIQQGDRSLSAYL